MDYKPKPDKEDQIPTRRAVKTKKKNHQIKTDSKNKKKKLRAEEKKLMVANAEIRIAMME